MKWNELQLVYFSRDCQLYMNYGLRGNEHNIQHLATDDWRLIGQCNVE